MIFNTTVTSIQLLNMIIFELGISEPSWAYTKMKAIQRINDFAIQQLAEGGNVVIIIDEAQNLSPAMLEDLRLLSNLETRKHKLVQIVLSGQPELDNVLGRHDLRQFKERISIRRYVLPLTETETYAYLRHRLEIVQYSGSSLFSRRAQQLIWDYSQGIPRRVNILCDNALLIGYGMQRLRIGADEIKEAAEDLTWERLPQAFIEQGTGLAGERGEAEIGRKRFKVLTLALALLLIVGLAFAGGYFLHGLLRVDPVVSAMSPAAKGKTSVSGPAPGGKAILKQKTLNAAEVQGNPLNLLKISRERVVSSTPEPNEKANLGLPVPNGTGVGVSASSPKSVATASKLIGQTTIDSSVGWLQYTRVRERRSQTMSYANPVFQDNPTITLEHTQTEPRNER